MDKGLMPSDNFWGGIEMDEGLMPSDVFGAEWCW